MGGQISIAKVLKPKGLKGELKCLPLVEKQELFSALQYIICDDKKINVISSTFRLGFVYIMLENIDNIDLAEKFRGKIFYINKEDFGDLEQDNYFIEDLINCEVYTSDGQKIGEVLGVENYGASDILEIKDKWTTYGVPFIKKIFVDIDVKNQKLVVDKNQYEENKV